MQWLVKTAIETREEMYRQIRNRAVFEFSKAAKTPEVRHRTWPHQRDGAQDVAFEQSKQLAAGTAVAVKVVL